MLFTFPIYKSHLIWRCYIMENISTCSYINVLVPCYTMPHTRRYWSTHTHTNTETAVGHPNRLQVNNLWSAWRSSKCQRTLASKTHPNLTYLHSGVRHMFQTYSAHIRWTVHKCSFINVTINTLYLISKFSKLTMICSNGRYLWTWFGVIEDKLKVAARVWLWEPQKKVRIFFVNQTVAVFNKENAKKK